MINIWLIGGGLCLVVLGLYELFSDRGSYPLRQNLVLIGAIIGMSAIWFITAPALAVLGLIKFHRRRAAAHDL